MAEITVTVEHIEGLHARPASLFVQEAQKYQSTIIVINEDRTANAK
ncbi:MAG: HPr family phosphocarrier protein, partial [Chloroflexi bacterium]